MAGLSSLVAGSTEGGVDANSSSATIVDAIRETQKSFADLVSSLDVAAARAKENKGADRVRETEASGSNASKSSFVSKNELNESSDARFKFALEAYTANEASSASTPAF